MSGPSENGSGLKGVGAEQAFLLAEQVFPGAVLAEDAHPGQQALKYVNDPNAKVDVLYLFQMCMEEGHRQLNPAGNKIAGPSAKFAASLSFGMAGRLAEAAFTRGDISQEVHAQLHAQASQGALGVVVDTVNRSRHAIHAEDVFGNDNFTPGAD